MKIGMFTDTYTPVINGVVSSIESFRQCLIQKGHQVYTFAPQMPDYVEKAENTYRFSSFTFPFHKQDRVVMPLPYKNIKLIPQLKLDIIHTHTPFSLGLIGNYMAKKGKIPLVFTYHTLLSEYIHYLPVDRKLAKNFAVWLSRTYCNKCQAVIAPSKKIKELLLEYKVTVPIEVIPSGISLEKYNCGDKNWFEEKYPFAKDKQILLYLGRLGKEKNIGFLLETFVQIHRQAPQTYLFIVGGGPEKTKLEELAAKLQIQDLVTFTDYVKPEEVCHYYKAAYLFIFSSLTETQGLVIVEAKAGGCPVVAVDDKSGVADAVTSGTDGFLVELSQEAFTEKVMELLNNSLLRDTLSRNAQQEAKKLSIDCLTDRLLEVYQKAIDGIENSRQPLGNGEV